MTTFLKLLALGTALTLTLTSCSTMAGLGKDIQKGGAVIEKTAQ